MCPLFGGSNVLIHDNTHDKRVTVNTSYQAWRSHLGCHSNWLAFIAKGDETEAKPVLSQRVVVLIGRERSTALISIDGSSTLDSHVSLEQSIAGSLHVHLRKYYF